MADSFRELWHEDPYQAFLQSKKLDIVSSRILCRISRNPSGDDRPPPGCRRCKSCLKELDTLKGGSCRRDEGSAV